MATTTMRVNTALRDRVNELSRQLNISAGEFLEAAVDHYECDLFWKRFARAATHASAEPGLVRRQVEDQALYDSTLKDGLAPEMWDDAPATGGRGERRAADAS